MNRFARWVAFAAATVILMTAPVVQAAEAGHEEAEPSLFAGDLGNALWTLIIFVLLLIVLGKFAWKPILAVLQKREQFIHDSLAQARRDRQEAEARLKTIEERLSAARAEATAIVEEGRRDADVVKRKAQHDARQEADAMIERAKREIGLARDTAIKEVYDRMADLATTAAGRIIGRQLDATGHERLIAEAIDELAAGDSHRTN